MQAHEPIHLYVYFYCSIVHRYQWNYLQWVERIENIRAYTQDKENCPQLQSVHEAFIYKAGFDYTGKKTDSLFLTFKMNVKKRMILFNLLEKGCVNGYSTNLRIC